ncbi:MAG TPA: CbrC family protein [Ktedonobacterales bacterium]|nr:CbrC family protein [Ktedonobacterales bacterium]
MVATYRYFAHPHQFSTYQEQPEQCGVCGERKPGYAGPFYGPLDIEFVCEDCLTSGRLKSLDISTNSGDIAALRAQLRILHSSMSEDERERIAQERSAELAYQTPLPVT